ncbi:hypothetical protein PR202_ga01800 [Eleusine coracana subsp. coracana]|uniref:Uncharacterized protein n=1 Tax=Eleusine coracana subsp. coracana TaxID=191504 RepID=A0AAV5BJ87_ELECO|nr:hypothetical protein PR202_ga01113 [Eleusine coracana subsp. coracana]GJM85987.1 hypothetical protein PR202_ga01800 [Eleusine coracana subsp. coracana]
MARTYERRLLAAADFILSADGRDQEGSPSPSDLGVTADLKPHQLHGVAWLIRRYRLGVNVVLGSLISSHLLPIAHLQAYLTISPFLAQVMR